MFPNPQSPISVCLAKLLAIYCRVCPKGKFGAYTLPLSAFPSSYQAIRKMGKTLSKSSRRNGSIKVVYSVCGHSENRRENEVVDPRHCLFGIGESWLPKNTERRAGWCSMCAEHYERHQLDILSENVIENHWNYLASHKWTKPVEPTKVRISALRACSASTSSSKQWPVHELVAACLYSLRLDASTSRPRTLAAAKIIRDGTLAWAPRVKAEARSRAQKACSEYLCSKPLPRTPDLCEQSWNPFAPYKGDARDTQVSALQELNTAIDETLQNLQWMSESLLPIIETSGSSWTLNNRIERDNTTSPARYGKCVHAQDDGDDDMPLPSAGSFRIPSYRTPSPPPRPSRSLARCQIHGHIDSFRVDMSCNICACLGLNESTVPVGSPPGHRSCDLEFLQVGTRRGVLAAMHGTYYCNEGPLSGVLTCDPCLARRNFALRTGVAWL